MIRALPAWILAWCLMGCSASEGGSSTPAHPIAADSGLDAVPADATFEEVQEAAAGDVSTEAAVGPDALADAPVPGADCTSTVERQFACCTFVAVNDFRISQGLQALAWDPKIAEAAAWYSQYMADAGLLEHGLDGRMVGMRLSDFGVDWTAAGENIARNTTDSWQQSCVQVFEQWDGSPSHHALMVTPKYTDGAVGVARGGGWWYATLNVVAH
jgi:uncharacterized protein YkwD